MAGKGLRLYPYTINMPKPFFSIAGQYIIKRILKNLHEIIYTFSVKEIIFIIKPFYNNSKIENELKNFSYNIGINPIIYYQEKPMGTADALLKAKKSLIGPIIVVFSDTIFYNNTSFEKDINKASSNIIWTKKVSNPNLYGIVKCDPYNSIITNFLEKPKNFVSDLAMIGLYYFQDGSKLKKELQCMSYTEISHFKEYQLTSVLEKMREKGVKFVSKPIKKWIDFGDKKTIIASNSKILSIEHKIYNLIHKQVLLKNSIVIQPCSIEKGTIIENSIIGPFVSIGKFSKIKNSNIRQSIIQNYTLIVHANLINSIIGNYSKYNVDSKEVNLGDYSEIF